jgi:hypothetical protein
VRERLSTSWTKPSIGTKLLREVMVGMFCLDCLAAVAGNETDDGG